MSKHHIEKVTCPSCHHEGDFEVWDSINTVLDPEMKEKVLNQSIFLYTCPNCGETFRLNYPTLYHQMEDLVMIYLVPESEVEKTYEMFYGENALADYRTEKYLNRIVTSANQLIEKIKIFDAGKDDRIIELVKLLAADSILKNNPAIDFDELRFAVDDDGTNILVIINKGVNVSLHFADRNNVQLTVANTESKPAAARIICNCPRLMFGRLMVEYSIWNDVFKQSVPNAASKRCCPLRTASSL